MAPLLKERPRDSIDLERVLDVSTEPARPAIAESVHVGPTDEPRSEKLPRVPRSPVLRRLVRDRRSWLATPLLLLFVGVASSLAPCTGPGRRWCLPQQSSLLP